MKLSSLKQLFVVSCALATVGTTFVFAASGGVGGRPANPDPDNPRTQSIFIYTIQPGGFKNDQIYLSNGGSTDEVVQLYAVDGTVSNTGAFTCKQEVEERTDMGKAIQLSKNEVTVPANGNLLVDFTVTLPKTIDVGEHDGCIVIQKKEDEGQKTGSIQVHTRTAVRLVALVPGDVHREISINDFKAVASYKKGDKTVIGPQVSFGLKNAGNVSADVLVNVHMRDVFGNEVRAPGSSDKVFFSGQYPVLPGTIFAVNYDAEYQPFFGGWYKVKADSTYNKEAGTFGVNTSGDTVRVESQEITIFFWPSPLFFIILALLVMAAVSFISWHFMQKREVTKRARHALKKSVEKPLWGQYQVKEGDTLKELAKGTGVPVNKIGIMNRLQSPYTITPGQTIYLPRKRE